MLNLFFEPKTIVRYGLDEALVILHIFNYSSYLEPEFSDNWETIVKGSVIIVITIL